MGERDQGDLIGGLILITLGGTFLLMNYGYLSWELWGEIWKLWPLFLIIAGISIFLGKGTCRWCDWEKKK